MTTHPSLVGRAFLAVFLTIGFYALALGFSAILLVIPLLMAKTHTLALGKLGILSLIAGLTILWSIVPRVDRFRAPGPELSAEEDPALFDLIREVAVATDQREPEAVFLVQNVNAWVADRGGILGFGARRVMGVGLPLLQAVSVSQLRGILAHEFGHFRAGDTLFGGWIYKTRATIIRTIVGLQGAGGWIQAPFNAYGKRFMLITQGVSRQQELAADRLAAHIVGKTVFLDGLRRVHSSAPAFDAFWSQEAAPVFARGYYAPVTDGFARYLATKNVSEASASWLARELESDETSEYDSHPSLRERIDALADVPDPPTQAQTDRPAVDLLSDLPARERSVLAFFTDGHPVDRLPVTAWEDVGMNVWVASWREEIRGVHQLAGVTPRLMPALLEDLDPFAMSLGKADVIHSMNDIRAYALFQLGATLAVTLADAGFHISALPGEPVVASRGDLTFMPFETRMIRPPEPSAKDRWIAMVESAGIADVDFGTKVQP